MLLNNFEEALDEKIVDRGRAYYQDGNVLELEEMEPGVYQATVEGSEDYQVTIVLGPNREIAAHECDCPYDWGEYCKHEAAVLFALRERLQSTGKPGKAPQEVPKKPDLGQVIRDMPREDLEAIVFEAAERDQNLNNRLLLLYRQKPPTDAEIRKLIHDGIRPYSRRGYVEYRDTGRALEGIDEALGIAEKQKSPVDTARIAMTIVSALETVMNQVDDSDGYLGGYFGDCVELLRGAAERADAGERDKIFLIGLEQAAKTELWGGQGLELLKALVPFADDAGKRDLINGRLDEIAQKGSEWTTAEACLMRMSLLEQSDPAQARRYLEAHVELPRFRQIAIQRAVEEGDYALAEQLARAGVEQDRELPGLVRQWRFCLADIAHATGDLALERETLGLMCAANDREAYPRLKALYSEAEWPAVRDGILDVLGSKRWPPDLYADMLAQEGLTDRLMAYCEKLPQQIFTYYPQLAGPYPEQTDALFLQLLRERAKPVGDRRGYQALCDSIKIYGEALGTKQAQALVQELRTKYVRRPALLDELGKLEKALARNKSNR